MKTSEFRCLENLGLTVEWFEYIFVEDLLNIISTKYSSSWTSRFSGEDWNVMANFLEWCPEGPLQQITISYWSNTSNSCFWLANFQNKNIFWNHFVIRAKFWLKCRKVIQLFFIFQEFEKLLCPLMASWQYWKLNKNKMRNHFWCLLITEHSCLKSEM
jgi:hypothetical protein